jgi:hypothetical protein
VVTACIICIKIKELCVLYDSHNKQQLLPPDYIDPYEKDATCFMLCRKWVLGGREPGYLLSLDYCKKSKLKWMRKLPVINKN